MRTVGLVVLTCWMVISLGCEVGPRSGRGLRLPDGDVRRGQEAYFDLGCNECHAIAGEFGSSKQADSDVVVVLGGQVAHIETYGELVTSIVNPSHGVPRRYPKREVSEAGESKMVNFNRVMTVEELIDLTAFLQSKYELQRDTLYRD